MLKNISIILLVILVLLLTIFLIFSKIENAISSESTSLLKDINKLQSNISFYIGKTYSETFGIYNSIQILSGVIDENDETSVIKDSKDVQIVPIINLKSKVEKNGKLYYEIDKESIQDVLKFNIPEYKNVKWYIEDGEIIKVQFDNKPEWWDESLDIFLLEVK